MRISFHNPLFTILLLLFALCANAKSTNQEEAVSLVSFEQRWLDDNGTLALKNNTKEPIKNLHFLIEYQNIDGTPLDYEEFAYNIEIAPGMTRKLEIPAYESSRHYEYYKTSDHSNFPQFKIRFQLKDFNVSEKEASNYSNPPYSRAETSKYAAIILIILALIILGISIGLYILVGLMAKKRNRNVALWIIISLIATPFLSIIILLCVGQSTGQEYYN